LFVFLLRRSAQSVVSLVLLLALVFFVSRLTGDPTNLYLPLNASDEARDSLRQRLGLDEPVPVQFVSFVASAVRLDFGESLWLGSSALSLVLERLPATLALALTTLALSIVLSILLGLLASLRRGSLLDRAIQLGAVTLASIPDFWLALILILTLALGLGWFPTSGTGDVSYAVLPILTLMARPVGVLVQMVRASLLEEKAAAYTVTAYSKGLRTWEVLYGHGLRNALIPVVTVAGDFLVQMVNGVVVVEVIFGWPGIGKLTIDAVNHRDYAIIQAAVFVVALLVFAVNFLVDLTYSALDPRIRQR
jgi:peptide/nickel transport system permease protein